MPENEIVVFQLISREASCSECGAELGKGRLLRKEKEKGLCMECSDLSHLVFLGAGDACITRRASKYSPLRAIVLRWSRSRKRYERQGILVSDDAVRRAEEECLGDAEARARRQQYNSLRRDALDVQYVAAFAAEIRRHYPKAPAAIAEAIAEHACELHSGRIGRTARAKDFDPDAIDLATRAFIRHQHTRYDELLGRGVDREEARALVRGEIDSIAGSWRADE
jgi:hypothetical protein